VLCSQPHGADVRRLCGKWSSMQGLRESLAVCVCHHPVIVRSCAVVVCAARATVRVSVETRCESLGATIFRPLGTRAAGEQSHLPGRQSRVAHIVFTRPAVHHQLSDLGKQSDRARVRRQSMCPVFAERQLVPDPSDRRSACRVSRPMDQRPANGCGLEV
jgi:hypothetical protein